MDENATYQLSIITPEGQVVDNEVQSLVAPGLFGQFGVLAKHAPMMMQLVPGVLSFHDTKKDCFFGIDSGILEVDTQSNVVVLVDQAEACESKESAKIKAQELTAHGQPNT